MSLINFGRHISGKRDPHFLASHVLIEKISYMDFLYITMKSVSRNIPNFQKSHTFGKKNVLNWYLSFSHSVLLLSNNKQKPHLGRLLSLSTQTYKEWSLRRLPPNSYNYSKEIVSIPIILMSRNYHF